MENEKENEKKNRYENLKTTKVTLRRGSEEERKERKEVGQTFSNKFVFVMLFGV